MGTILFGLKMGVGIAIGLLVTFFIWGKIRAIRDFFLKRNLVMAGFTWEENLQGWLSRDPYNDDWILWDEKNKRMLQRTDPEDICYVGEGDWRPSGESLEQCVSLGGEYRVRMGF